jgi:hypothetical protein
MDARHKSTSNRIRNTAFHHHPLILKALVFFGRSRQ